MIERVARLEHMGYFDTALDQGSTLRLQERLQNDCPIRRLTMFYDLGGVVLGGLVPIAEFTVSAVPSATSHISNLNLLHRSTTRLSSWKALNSLLL